MNPSKHSQPQPRRPTSSVGRPRHAVTLATALAVAALTSGCIVNTATAGMGTLEVQWAAGDCSPLGVGTVRVEARQGGVTIATKGGIACQKGSTTLVLNPGVYTIFIDGFSNGGNALTSAAIDNVVVDANMQGVTPIVGLQGGTGGGGGGVVGKNGAIQLAWTVAGKPAASGCLAHGLDKVILSALDESKTKVLASGEVACNAGSVNLVDVPEGRIYVQLDGVAADGSTTFGNSPLLGPIDVTAAATVLIQNPIDLVDLRAVISLDWQFSDGGTCGSHNVGAVFVELTDLANGAKVVVPMNDPWAKKPCDIGPTASYEARVIDMQFATPTCAIPAGAKGLVICGVRSAAIGVRVSALDLGGTKIFYGGSMKIEEIPQGQHTGIQTPLLLSTCDTVQNVCGAP